MVVTFLLTVSILATCPPTAARELPQLCHAVPARLLLHQLLVPAVQGHERGAERPSRRHAVHEQLPVRLAAGCRSVPTCVQLVGRSAVMFTDPFPLLCSTVLMFPTELGGGSLSAAAYQRLQQCPVADPPCADQQVGPGLQEAEMRPICCRHAVLTFHLPLKLLQSATVFGTLGPAVVPAAMGQDIKCLSGKYEEDCATECASTNGCSGFLYTAQGSSSGDRSFCAG